MPQDHSFEFPLPNGMHARPASQLEAMASRFRSSMTLHCGRNHQVANVHSVLSLISADIRHGDSCILHVEGEDEDSAFAAIVDYLKHEFPKCDEALAVDAETHDSNKLHRVLAALGVDTWWSGQKISGTLAIAPLVRLEGLSLADDFFWPSVDSQEIERQRVASALDAVKRDLERQIAAATGDAAEILRAQLGMLVDATLRAGVEERIEGHRESAGQAIVAVIDSVSARLRAGSNYLRERVADLQDVCARLLIELYGESAVHRTPELTHNSILVAADLSPGQFLAVDRRYLSGIVLEEGGATSHTSILARAAGVPMLIGVKGSGSLSNGSEALLDATRGVLIASPSADVLAFYQQEMRRYAALADDAAGWSRRPALSADAVALPHLANVATAADVEEAMKQGAEGIGLFRTELLFMNRASAPDEDEQVAIYSEAVRNARGGPLVIRTLDIGGDKPITYLDLPVEPNPFLGLRGVRLYQRFPSLIRAQIRAILKASACGPVKIMVPMITCAEEMADFRALVDEVQQELGSGGCACSNNVEIGAMLEVPAAVFAVPEIARHADFFSIGSNDLAQYFLAADRDNPSTTELGSWRHPSFLRLLQMAVSLAHQAGRPVGLCGDLASQPEALPLHLGLGFDSISLGPAGIPASKIALSRLTRAASIKRLNRALEAGDRAAVDAVLSSADEESLNRPLLEPGLFQPKSTAANKACVINELVALAAAAGRTRNAVALEEAVWTREETYPTNFGHGFAVPHCHSSLVSAPVIALLRLEKPVKWSDDEDSLVHVALLLAMPAGENQAHLKIFARLSRMIMREEFRSALETAPDAVSLMDVLADALAPVLPAVNPPPLSGDPVA